MFEGQLIIGSGFTVREVVLVPVPPVNVVTDIVPEALPEGTTAVNCVELTIEKLAAFIPLN